LNITITLNGSEVIGRPGMTILELTQESGVYIPTLCHDSHLIPTGSCGVCLVEDESNGNLLTACNSPIQSGMRIRTDSPRVIEERRIVVERILANHPDACLICEKGNRCALRKIASELGIGRIRFDQNRSYIPLQDDNPFIIRDLSKCIHCDMCIRACQELQGARAYDQSNFDKPMKETLCEFCGLCVSLCPVGALSEKIGKYRDWAIKEVRTVCPYCGCGCSICLHVRDNQILGISAAEDNSVNGGLLCVKGHYGLDFVNHKDRLLQPLIRRNEKLEEASWEAALNLVAERLKQIKQDYGSDSIALMSSAKCTNEENYLFQKFARTVIGTNNIDHCARLCHASTLVGLVACFGAGAMTNSIGEIENAEVIVVIGSNTSETHPIIAMKIRRAVRQKGARLIVIDPRGIPMTRYATIWLRQKPGTDVALLNGLMHVIIKENLWAKDYVEKRTEGFEELKRVVEKYPPSIVEEITGIPQDKLTEAARMYATAKTAMIFFTMGITQHSTGTDNVKSVANLAMLCGKVGIESGGVNPLRGQNNVQGACDMGALPDFLPGYRSVADSEVVGRFEKAWGAKLPTNPGLTVVEMMKAAGEGRIKAMYIMGENPMLSDPDIAHVSEGLKNLKFLVVQDIFLTETARLADVVFPAVTFAEKDGTFTNTERRVQLVRKAIEPLGEAKPDWEIITQLSSRMGYPLKYSHPAEIMEEIARLTSSYAGIDYKRLEKGGLQWPCLDKAHPGTRYLHRERFTRGLGLFQPVEYLPPAEMPDEEYPFVLSTGRVLYHFHTGSMSRRAQGLAEIYPESEVEINPLDAQKLDITEGAIVKLTSRRGQIRVRAAKTERVPQGMIFLNFHFAEAAVNKLTNPALDPIAKIPEYKVCAVKVEREAKK